MNAYWAAQIEAIWSGEAPIWEAQVLENVLAGSILSTHDDGDTWHLTRMDDFNDILHAGALALQDSRAGETIKMTSRGEMHTTVVIAEYAPLRIRQVGEDGSVVLDLSQDGA